MSALVVSVITCVIIVWISVSATHEVWQVKLRHPVGLVTQEHTSPLLGRRPLSGGCGVPSFLIFPEKLSWMFKEQPLFF